MLSKEEAPGGTSRRGERRCGMKQTKYSIKFLGGVIDVWAFNYTEAKILAQAEAIKRGWNYEIQK